MTEIEKKVKGLLEIEIAGEKRGFKFGILQMAQLKDLEKCSIKELAERFDDPENFMVKVHLFYSGAYQYAKLKGIPPPTVEEVGSWMDELMDQQKEELNRAAFSTFQDPNEKAPEATGQS